MREHAIAVILVVAASAGSVLAGPKGSTYLFNTPINPFDGSAGAADIFRCAALVSVLFTQQNYSVRVAAPNPPTNPNFPCPFVLLCDSPIYPPFCVSVAEFVINPVAGRDPCAFAVANGTWSSVKRLCR